MYVKLREQDVLDISLNNKLYKFLYNLIILKKNNIILNIINNMNFSIFNRFCAYIDNNINYEKIYHLFKIFIIKNYKKIKIDFLFYFNKKYYFIIEDKYIISQIIKNKNNYLLYQTYSNYKNSLFFIMKYNLHFNNNLIVKFFNFISINNINITKIIKYYNRFNFTYVSSITEFLINIFWDLNNFYGNEINEIFYKTFDKNIRYSKNYSDDFNFYKYKMVEFFDNKQMEKYIKYLYINYQIDLLNQLKQQDINDKMKNKIDSYLFLNKINKNH